MFDHRPIAFAPDRKARESEDYHNDRMCATYQVGFPVPSVDQIPRIGPGEIRKRISLPLVLVRSVFGHDVFQLLYIHSSTINAIARSEDHVDIVDKLVKGIQRFG